jgi:hypothetical protein
LDISRGSIWFARFDGSGWSIASDRRRKSDIVEMDDVLERFLEVEFTTFHLNGAPEESRSLGVIAQQVQPLFPEAVSDSGEGPEGEENYLMVKPSDFTFLAGRALQEFHERQSATNAELRAQLAAQAERIADLEAALAAERASASETRESMESRLSRLESALVSLSE